MHAVFLTRGVSSHRVVTFLVHRSLGDVREVDIWLSLFSSGLNGALKRTTRSENWVVRLQCLFLRKDVYWRLLSLCLQVLTCLRDEFEPPMR